MRKEEIIDRYVYAVIKNLPGKQAKDIERELRGLIEDMLAERCGECPAQEKDVLVVLTELGTPQELAAQYDVDGESCLIGQPYYSQYKLVTKWVLLAVALGLLAAWIVATAVLVVSGTATLQSVGASLLDWGERTISAMLSAVGALTILYAFLQRKKIALPDSADSLVESLSKLPAAPGKKEKISRADAIAEIIFSVLFMILFLAVPEVICGVFQPETGTEVIRVFQTEVLRSRWYLITGITFLGVLKGAFELIEGRRTMRLAIAITVGDVCSFVLMAFLITAKGLVNPELLQKLQTVFTGEKSFIYELFANIDKWFLEIFGFALLIELAVTWYHTLKYREK